MRTRIFVIVLVLFLLQALLIAFLVLRPSLNRPAARTPIPTLALATMPASMPEGEGAALASGECQIRALDLIGAWVAADKPEGEAFEFEDMNGENCQASFEQDVLPLFTEPNIWYTGSLSCASCHGADLSTSAAQLNLGDYEGILAGSRRENANATGGDILGDATNWETSKLFVMIHTRAMPIGRPPTSPERGPVVRVGTMQ